MSSLVLWKNALLLTSLSIISACAALISGNGSVDIRRRRPLTSPSERREKEDFNDEIREGSGSVSIESYWHKGFKLTYLHKKAALGREKDRPIILIHPVGIGLSSWFWTKLMESFACNPPIYAPDLIGCGIEHGADAWNPDERGLFFPLSWVEGVETLISEVVLPQQEEIWQGSLSQFFGNNQSGTSDKGCLVVTQGGLAPVGVMLASRNPVRVEKVVLTSPPTYMDMTTAVPKHELDKNYKFLRSPIFGKLAFSILETRGAIQFFSNLFLFEEECDERWLFEAQRETRPEARAPVQAFNAGLLQHRSFQDELRGMPQPLLVVSGARDRRETGRQMYLSELKGCTLATIEGCNVLPWENPSEVVNLIRELGY